MARLRDGLLAQPIAQFQPAAESQWRVNPVQAGTVGGAEYFVRRRFNCPQELGARSQLRQARNERFVVFFGREAYGERRAGNLRGQLRALQRRFVRFAQAQEYSTARTIAEYVAFTTQIRRIVI